MNVAPVIFELLRTDTTIKGYVGERIYPDSIPQNIVYPAIVHFETDNDSPIHKDDDSGVTNHSITVQFDIYAAKFGDTKAIATAIRDRLHYYSGTVKNIVVRGIFYRSQTGETFVEQNEAYVTTQSYLFKTVSS